MFYNELRNGLNKTEKDNRVFYKSIQYGLIFGLKHYSLSVEKEEITKLVGYSMVQVNEFIKRHPAISISEFYKWELDRLNDSNRSVVFSTKNGWNWVQTIEMGL